jgi:hypothetical protein
MVSEMGDSETEGTHDMQDAPVDTRRPIIGGEEQSTLRAPLLEGHNNDGVRHRPIHHREDVEMANNESRILDRSAAFHQSRGRWGVERRVDGIRRYCCCCVGRIWSEWIAGDWFHRLAYKRTCDLMLILFIIYCAIVVFFAFVYYGVSMFGQEITINPDGSKKIIAFCDMEINDRMEALYFSLSTMTTIGYGVSDYYFGECWTPLLLVLWQVCSAIWFHAVATGLIFQRIARGRKRGKQIAFSNKALVQRVNGVPYLMFRIGEMRSYHLMEATVRCYCIRHERLAAGASRRDNDSVQSVETTYFVSRQVKLLHPDEAYGSRIWMGLPQVVIHRMDASSPLVPPSPVWYDEDGAAHSYAKPREEPQTSRSSPGPQDDEYITDLAEIEKFLLDREAEVLVLVEGTDEGTGSATQARHSYKAADLAWNHTFVPCVFPYQNRNRRRRQSNLDPVCSVDFMRFHDSVEVPPNSEACAYIPQ